MPDRQSRGGQYRSGKFTIAHGNRGGESSAARNRRVPRIARGLRVAALRTRQLRQKPPGDIHLASVAKPLIDGRSSSYSDAQRHADAVELDQVLGSRPGIGKKI